MYYMGLFDDFVFFVFESEQNEQFRGMKKS